MFTTKLSLDRVGPSVLLVGDVEGRSGEEDIDVVAGTEEGEERET